MVHAPKVEKLRKKKPRPAPYPCNTTAGGGADAFVTAVTLLRGVIEKVLMKCLGFGRSTRALVPIIGKSRFVRGHVEDWKKGSFLREIEAIQCMKRQK